MISPKITVIVPVFNKEKMLLRCLRSVQKQTFKDWELIALNDKSTDSSKNIIEQIAATDSRIMLVDNSENQGVDKTRFNGLELAKGEYVFFLDADDWISTDALEKLYNTILRDNSDIVIGNFYRVLDRQGLLKTKYNNLFFVDNNVIKNPDLFDRFFLSYFGINFLPVQMCGKLYRLQTIKKAGISPTGYRMGEDLIFNMKLHPFLNKISLINDRIYFYTYGGLTSGFNPTLLHDIKEQFVLKLEMINAYGYTKAVQPASWEVVNVFFSYFESLLLYKGIKRDELIAHIQKELSDPLYTQLKIETQFDRYMMINEKKADAIADQLMLGLMKKKIKFKAKRLLSEALNIF